MKKIASISIICLLTSISVFAYSGGNGTEKNPYLISSKADMEEWAWAAKGGNEYYSNYFQLTTDIAGIKTCINSFRGTFDGNGHEIEIDSASFGVFKSLSGATIKNLGVKGTIGNYGIYMTMGGIAGEIEFYTTITNCYNAANITLIIPIDWAMPYATAGGICGSCASNCLLINCYNVGNISSINYSAYSATYSQAGGICGSSGGTIKNCYNTGIISSQIIGNSRGFACAGGICGSGEDITNCFSAAPKITSQNYNNYSDLIGKIQGIGDRISNCYALSTTILNNGNNQGQYNGIDAIFANFQSQSWIQNNLQWDFQTIWTMSNINDPIHKGLPILKGINNVNGISVINQNEFISVSVFPNPAKDDLFFKSNSPIKRMEICNISGFCIFVKENADERINISDFPSGMYVVKVYTDKGLTTKKIIKK